MNVYYENEKAGLLSSSTKAGSNINFVYDPMLELRADFISKSVTIGGRYEDYVAVDSLCLGYTNATSYELITEELEVSGICRDRITIHDLKETIFINSFILRLEGLDPLYLGHLFLGKKVILPRFIVEPKYGINLRGEVSHSSGGQVLGIKRNKLSSFSVNYKRLSLEEKNILESYVNEVQNVQPHIIDPYTEVRQEFPPMYATISNSNVTFPKRNEPGFYYNGSLSWQEAR